MIEAVDTSSPSTLRTGPQFPTVSSGHARQRTSTVMMTVGLTQVLPLALTWLAGIAEMTGRLQDKRDWLAAVALGGAAYVATALPVRFGWRPALWLGLSAAAAQAGVFILLALLAVIAAFNAGTPASMTMGVLLFGSIASLHLFIARWIWPLLREDRA